MTSDTGFTRSRLRWRCRRGMKELDILFERFLASGFERLDDEHLDALAELLDAPDQDILEWIDGRVPPPEALAEIIASVRGDR